MASESETIWGAAQTLAVKIAEDPRIATLDADLHLKGLHFEVMRYALHSEETAMMRGDAATAMEYLETAIAAREQLLEASHGLLGFSPLPYIDPYPLEDAAAVGRTDLIDRAIAVETANSDADKGNGGHYEARIAVQNRIRESVPQLKSILDAAERSPGIRQIDLSASCPGADNRTISHLVDQLAAVGILATEKVGSRVHVWPAGHADAPTGDRLRRTARDAERELDQRESVPFWQLNPEKALEWAQHLVHLMQTSMANPERDTTPVPQPTDFHLLAVMAAEAEGHLCFFTEQPDEMVFWGHVDDEVVRRILGNQLELHGVPSKRRQKWLGEEVRYTHLKREKLSLNRNGKVRDQWILREAEAQTQWTAPVTVLNSPAKAPKSNSYQIAWLAKEAR